MTRDNLNIGVIQFSGQTKIMDLAQFMDFINGDNSIYEAELYEDEGHMKAIIRRPIENAES